MDQACQRVAVRLTSNKTERQEVVGVEDSARFAFGENWSKFLAHVDEERITASMRGLREMLGVETLAGTSFLDVGSGSGLSSLAARRLHASVHSFDFDPASVASTNELRRRYFSDDDQWKIEQGSVLDEAFLRSLGQFDVVYSWGVLHHSGDMWRAMENVVPLVRPGGKLLIAIYNDHGRSSRAWTVEKRIFANSPRGVQVTIGLAFTAASEMVAAVMRLCLGQLPSAGHRWRSYKRNRGMSIWHDSLDWLGGYPFQYARPEEVFTFFRHRGFQLEFLKTTPHNGCNEYTFKRVASQ